MDTKKVSIEIFNALGGRENITSNAVCMTRLRVGVKNAVDIERIKKINGVLSVIEADTIQIVLGPSIVNKVGEEFTKLTKISLGFTNVEKIAMENKKENNKKT